MLSKQSSTLKKAKEKRKQSRTVAYRRIEQKKQQQII